MVTDVVPTIAELLGVKKDVMGAGFLDSGSMSLVRPDLIACAPCIITLAGLVLVRGLPEGGGKPLPRRLERARQPYRGQHSAGQFRVVASADLPPVLCA